MKGINFFIAAVLVMVFSGCSSKPVTGFKTVYDTITRQKIITYRDTVLITEKTTVTLVTDCNDVSEIPKVKQKKNAKLTLAKTSDGKLTASCECDTLTIKAKLKDELQKERQTTVRTETKIQKEKYVPGWVKIFAWIGILSVLGIITFYIKIK
jgi:IMP dehydrogenase/GMP reductase